MLNNLQIPSSPFPRLQQPATCCNQQYQSFPEHPIITPSQNTIHIYIKQSWRHQTKLSHANINRKPLTHIHSLQYTCRTIYIKTRYYFQHFSWNSYTLSIYHIPCHAFLSHTFSKSTNAHNTSFSYGRYFSHTCLIGNT